MRKMRKSWNFLPYETWKGGSEMEGRGGEKMRRGEGRGGLEKERE